MTPAVGMPWIHRRSRRVMSAVALSAAVVVAGCSGSSTDLTAVHEILHGTHTTCTPVETMNIEDLLNDRPAEKARLNRAIRDMDSRRFIYAEKCQGFTLIGHSAEDEPRIVDVVLVPEAQQSSAEAVELRDAGLLTLVYRPSPGYLETGPTG